VNKWQNPPAGLQHLAFPSTAMGHKVGVSILPPAHQGPAPLIIFLHGRGGDETTDLWAFMPLVRKAVAAAQLPEPLVVFPNGGMTAYRGAMMTMIVKELLPYLEQHYRILPERRHRLVAGFSMGGGGAVHLALQHPEAFGGAASWGGGVWHGDIGFFESVVARSDLLRELDPQFLLVNGSEDRPNAFRPLIEVFQQVGIAYQPIILEGVEHDMGVYLQGSTEKFADFLRLLWADPP
jgi:endo-1,4-beta-xylanase